MASNPKNPTTFRSGSVKEIRIVIEDDAYEKYIVLKGKRSWKQVVFDGIMKDGASSFVDVHGFGSSFDSNIVDNIISEYGLKFDGMVRKVFDGVTKKMFDDMIKKMFDDYVSRIKLDGEKKVLQIGDAKKLLSNEILLKNKAFNFDVFISIFEFMKEKGWYNGEHYAPNGYFDHINKFLKSKYSFIISEKDIEMLENLIDCDVDNNGECLDDDFDALNTLLICDIFSNLKKEGKGIDALDEIDKKNRVKKRLLGMYNIILKYISK